jgi:hypothetical protein
MTYIGYDVFVLQGIDDLSESDKLTVAQFIMDKEFKTEVYRDLEKWIASQNALARKKI